MPNSLIRRPLARLAALSLAAVSWPALAQSASQSAPSAATLDDDGTEIIVTAQKRAQALQDVGITISAFRGETIDDLGIKDATGLTSLVAGLSINVQGGEGNQPVIFLRGVGLNDFSENNASPIAIYLDEAYISSSAAQSLSLFDLERVEVLKGPQGTLYGRNATGGAIRFITRRPGPDLGASGRLSYAEFGTLRAEAAVNLPLSPDAGLRLSALRSESDGQFTNRLTGDDAGGWGITALRAAFDADVGDLEIGATLFGDINRGPGAAYSFRGVIDPATGGPCTADAVRTRQCVDNLGYSGEPGGTFAGAYDQPGRTERDIFGGILRLAYDFGPVELTSVSSYIDVDSLVLNDTDASPNRVLHLGFGVNSETFTQELRLSRATASYDLTVGAHFLTEKLVQNQTGDVFGAFRPIAESIDPVAYPGGFDPTGSALGAPIFFSRTRNEQNTRAYALFGQVEFDLFDKLRGIVGLRWSREERDFATDVRFEEPGFTVPLFAKSLDITDNSFSWRFGLDYRPVDDVLIYASVARGFKSGGFNGGILLDPAQVVPFGPEQLTAFEAGVKSKLLDGALRLNGAAFYYDYKDMQLFTLIDSGGLPTSVLTNAGKGEIKGLEAEIAWTPVASLDLALNAAWIDAKLTKFQTSPVFGSQDFSGNRLPKTPRFSVNLQAAYETPVGSWGKLKLLGLARYQSSTFFDTSNSDLLSEEAYVVVDTRVAVAHPDDDWEVAVFARNLFDRRYDVVAIDLSAFGFSPAFPGSRRVIGAEVALRF